MSDRTSSNDDTIRRNQEADLGHPLDREREARADEAEPVRRKPEEWSAEKPKDRR